MSADASCEASDGRLCSCAVLLGATQKSVVSGSVAGGLILGAHTHTWGQTFALSRSHTERHHEHSQISGAASGALPDLQPAHATRVLWLSSQKSACTSLELSQPAEHCQTAALIPLCRWPQNFCTTLLQLLACTLFTAIAVSSLSLETVGNTGTQQGAGSHTTSKAVVEQPRPATIAGPAWSSSPS